MAVKIACLSELVFPFLKVYFTPSFQKNSNILNHESANLFDYFCRGTPAESGILRKKTNLLAMLQLFAFMPHASNLKINSPFRNEFGQMAAEAAWSSYGYLGVISNRLLKSITFIKIRYTSEYY